MLPFHRLLGESLLLLTFTGRKSGTEYTTPVGYERREGTLYVTSQTDRVWWRNLRGGAPVTVRLEGVRRRGHATVTENDDAVAEYVLAFVERHGLDSVNRLAIATDSDEIPEKETLAAGLTDRWSSESNSTNNAITPFGRFRPVDTVRVCK